MPFKEKLKNLFFLAAKKPCMRFEKLMRAHFPPHDSIADVLHGVVVKDPFRPLEKIDAPETTAWVARQNERFVDFINPSTAARKEALEFLENAVPKTTRESLPSHIGDKYFVWRKAPGGKRYSLYIKDSPDEYAPARLLLNPVQIDPSGKTDIAGTYVTRDAGIIAYTLSKSGSDETTLKFMDIATGKNLDLTYENFRSSISWDHDGQGFHYNRPKDAESKTFEVCHHKMGAQPQEDRVVYSPNTEQTRAGLFRLIKDSTDALGTHDWLSISNTEPNKHALLIRPLGSDAPFREIFPHKEGTLSPFHEVNGKIYATTSLNSPKERVVVFDVNDPAPEKWTTLIPESKDDPLTSAFIWQNRLFVNYRHDTGELTKVFDLQGKHLHDMPIPPLSTYSMSGFRAEDKTCLISISNFQETGNVYEYHVETNQLTFKKKSVTPIDLKDCIVERIFATSKDGTKVPMSVIRHPDTKLDGTAATRLYGYGGFNISLDPAFGRFIAQWVRAGGIYVQANLRGGGEFGMEWYDAGRKKNKQNVFDDFAACAEYLSKNGYTSPARLAIEGGSNGGLLTLATVIQRPELFGAVISEVPVTDMHRFHIGSYYGYGWKSDYGDPDIKEDFNVAAKYSPLHNVKEGFKHPPILIKTDIHDDRVQPWHGFKMAATLQTKENEKSLTLLNVRTDGGHGAGMTEKQAQEDAADIFAFLHMTLGPIHQNDYKTTLSAKKDSSLNRILKKFGK